MPKRYLHQAEMMNQLRAVVALHGNQRAAAKALGISQQYISDILKGSRKISASVADKLGFVADRTYRKISA